MSGSGQGAPACTSRRNDDQSTASRPARPRASSRCRWVGTQNVVVGRRVEMAAAARAASNGPGSSTSPPASSVCTAKRSGALWCSGESTRCRSAGPNSQRSISSAARARASSSAQHAGPHALAAPGGARRVVHRPGQRHVGQVVLRVPVQQPLRGRRRGRARGRRPRPARRVRPPAAPGRAPRARSRCAAPRGRRPAAPARRRPTRPAGRRAPAPRRPARRPPAAGRARCPRRRRPGRRSCQADRVARVRPPPGPPPAAWPAWPGSTAWPPARAAAGTSA